MAMRRLMQPMKRSTCIGTIVTIIFFLTGCRLTYILQAAAGQFRLLQGALPVEEALRNDSLSATQKDRLCLVAKIKDFAEKELGLKKTSNYETIYTKSSQPPVYIVSAAPKDRLSLVTWWFPVVGKMPYLGFFDLDRARAEKKKLVEKDLDTVIGRAEAYSTLGWFKDPVTLNLIEGSTLDLVETILHEMTHTTLYKKGRGEFNEGLAVLVGKQGAYLFMQSTYGPSHPLTLEAQKSIRDEALFSTFLTSLLAKLEHLYDSSLTYEEKMTEREKVFAEALAQFKVLKGELQTRRFFRFGDATLNNAYLMSIALYHRHYHLFESVLRRNGNSIKEMLIFLKVLTKRDGNILKMMQDWLEGPGEMQSCNRSILKGQRLSPHADVQTP
ncbi:MAG: aminopeptidase, partial [Desulfobacteraceae bacterium]